MSEALKKSFQMGLACSIIALAHALTMHLSIKNAPLSASFISVSGTLVAGTAAWYWLIAKCQRYSTTRGFLVGLATGWISQYFGIAGDLVVSALAEHSTTLSNLVKAVFWSPVLTVFTFFLYGWMVILACSVTGVVLVKIQAKAVGNGTCCHHQ